MAVSAITGCIWKRLLLSLSYRTAASQNCCFRNIRILNRTSQRTSHLSNRSQLVIPYKCYSNEVPIQSQNDGPGKYPEDKYYYIDASDPETERVMQKDMLIVEDFLSEAEEQVLYNEVESYLKRLRYEKDHWDDAIHGYRETELRNWKEESQQILKRVQDLAFPPHVEKLAYTHILDIQKTGYIKAHVDSVRFCGSTIAGMSLLSSGVMRLVHDKNPERRADILIKQRSLYIMKDVARYEFTHEVLRDELSVFKGERIPRDRRISVICRNQPSPTDHTSTS